MNMTFKNNNLNSTAPISIILYTCKFYTIGDILNFVYLIDKIV